MFARWGFLALIGLAILIEWRIQSIQGSNRNQKESSCILLMDEKTRYSLPIGEHHLSSMSALQIPKSLVAFIRFQNESWIAYQSGHYKWTPTRIQSVRVMNFADLMHSLSYLSPGIAALESAWLYTRNALIKPVKEDVTLVTQFSVNRLSRFDHVLIAWPGPISAVVYMINPWDIQTLLTYLHQEGAYERHARVTWVFVKPSYSGDFRRYPINRLRNLGIRAALTDYIFYLEGDFVSNLGLYERMKQWIVPRLAAARRKEDGESVPLKAPSADPSDVSYWWEFNEQLYARFKSQPFRKRIAYVIACVAIVQSYSGPFPQTLSELSVLMRNGTAYITDPGAGHGPTRYTWFLSDAGRSLSDPPVEPISHDPPISQFYEVCYEHQYEPYYVVHKNDAPLYDERFFNQGGDKQQHALVMNALGYRFFVLRHAFVYHLDHDRSMSWPGGGMIAAHTGRDWQPVVKRLHSHSWPEWFPPPLEMYDGRYTLFADHLPEIEKRFGRGARFNHCKYNLISQERRSFAPQDPFV